MIDWDNSTVHDLSTKKKGRIISKLDDWTIIARFDSQNNSTIKLTYNVRWFKKDKIHKNGSIYDDEEYNYDWYNCWWFKKDKIHKNGSIYDDEEYNYDWLDRNYFNRKREYRNQPGVLFDYEWLDFERFNEKWFKSLGWIHSNWTYLDDKRNDANYYRTEEMKILAWFKQEFIHRNGKYRDDEWYDYYDRDEDWFDRNKLDENWFNRAREFQNQTGVFYNKQWFNFEGFNEKWFNKWGLHRNGKIFDDDGYNIFDRDCDWFDRNKLDENWFNRSREYKNKPDVFFDEDWYNYLRIDENWFSQKWIHTSWISFRDFIVVMLAEKKYELSIKIYNDRTIYTKFLSRDKLQELIRDQVQKYINDYPKFYSDKLGVQIKPSRQQIDIIANMNQYLLVQARAGCGKTTSMKWKIHFLIHELWVPKEQIICLAFNTDVADEMKEILLTKDIKNGKDTEKYKEAVINAFTFHSLAYRMSNWYGISNDFRNDSHMKKIPHLDDIISFLADNDDVYSISKIAKEKIVSLYAQEMHSSEKNINILLDTMREDNLALLYTCIREEDWLEFQERDEKIVPLDYRETRAARPHKREGNNEYKTISWKKLVKSLWEKYITDFLFEHGIDYEYEPWIISYLGKNKDWKDKSWKADFRIYARHGKIEPIENEPFNKIIPHEPAIIIEFWWIDDDDMGKSDSGLWDANTKSDYLWVKKKKREFMDNHKDSYKFIEFSNKELWGLPKENRRIEFENIIKTRLEQNWIICRKLSKNELYQNFDEEFKTNIEKLVRWFINRSKQRRYSIDDMKSKIWEYEACRELFAFYRFAIRCYEAYQCILDLNSQLDFNDCIVRPIEEFEKQKKLPQRIQWHTGEIELSKLKYLIVDEFQDVSEIFYQLISTIKESNPEMHIICVWDDWQAINGFAWSEQKYIKNFVEYFENGQILPLNKTQRCSAEITEIVKNFTLRAVTMEPARPGGKILGKKLEKIYIKNDKNALDDKEYYLESDKEYIGMNFAKMSKGISEEIQNNPIKQGTYYILSHNNKIYWIDEKDSISDHIAKLILVRHQKKTNQEGTIKETQTPLKDRIKVMTAHKAKWKTADMVFIVWHGEDWLNIHPNTKFGAIFWDTESSVLEEEKRLYYVALTRARSHICFLSADDVNNPKDDIIKPQRKVETTEKHIQSKSYDSIESSEMDVPF